MNRKFYLANTVTMNSAVLPHFKKTDSIMYLPMMKNVREKMRRLHLFDEGYKTRHSEGVSPKNLFNRSFAYAQDNEIAAFTLAETLITLTILGVVAAITVPSLINKQIESANRTKLKKAMTTYEKAINQMIIDQDAKGSLKTITGFDNTCSESTKYFKKVEQKSDCVFKTADRVWWDITDIENPIIILNDKYIGTSYNHANSVTEAQTENNKEVFAMLGYRDTSGVLRINDKGYEDGLGVSNNATNIGYMAKLYAFMNKETSSGSGSGGGTPSGGDEPEQTPSAYVPGVTPVNVDWDSLEAKLNSVKNTECTDEKVSCCIEAQGWGGYECYDETGYYFADYSKYDNSYNLYSQLANGHEINRITDYDLKYTYDLFSDEISYAKCDVQGSCNECISNNNSESACSGFSNCITGYDNEKICCKSGYHPEKEPEPRCVADN